MFVASVPLVDVPTELFKVAFVFLMVRNASNANILDVQRMSRRLACAVRMGLPESAAKRKAAPRLLYRVESALLMVPRRSYVRWKVAPSKQF